jgi:hypothetical protein
MNRLGRLRSLVVSKVALVDQGANPGATIELYKAAPLTVTTGTGNAATTSLTLSPEVARAIPCPECKSPVNRGEGICPSCGWTLADDVAQVGTSTPDEHVVSLTTTTPDQDVVNLTTSTTTPGCAQTAHIVEKRSDVMRVIDYLAKSEHAHLYAQSPPQAISRYVSEHPEWIDKHRAAEPDDEHVTVSVTSEPVEKIAGGERGQFPAEAISKAVDDIAATGLDWNDALAHFSTTRKGRALLDAYDDAVRS